MKTIQKINILAIMALLTISCDHLPDGTDLGEITFYGMSFTFVDSEGNNLAEGIDITDCMPADVPKEEAVAGEVAAEYKLDVILSKQSDRWNNKTYNIIDNSPDILQTDPNYPKLVYERKDGFVTVGNFLLFYTYFVEPQERMTYQITCPYIFGDDEMHILTTYWRGLEDAFTKPYGRKFEYFMKCYKVECDDQVITDISHDFDGDYLYRSNYVTLTIDKQ